jgi:DNA-binding response OmpR family regulator
MKILHIEDDESFVLLLHALLRKINPSVEINWVEDGTTGLNESLNGSYDLIICDGNLPFVNGPEIVSQSRQAGVKTPIIANSSNNQLNKIMITLGATNWINKSLSPNESENRDPNDFWKATLKS